MSTVKMVPGDDLYLTMLGAPMHFNLLVGRDRQDMLAYGRSVWSAALASRSAQTVQSVADDGALPASLLAVHMEWYKLCERASYADKITISGALAEAIVRTVATPPAAGGVPESFEVALSPEHEARFATWVGTESMTPWQRSVARLALLLNTSKRGLIDYGAAQHFARELMERTGRAVAHTTGRDAP